MEIFSVLDAGMWFVGEMQNLNHELSRSVAGANNAPIVA